MKQEFENPSLNWTEKMFLTSDVISSCFQGDAGGRGTPGEPVSAEKNLFDHLYLQLSYLISVMSLIKPHKHGQYQSRLCTEPHVRIICCIVVKIVVFIHLQIIE